MERPETKLKFPRSVWFIVCDELCERFNYFGLRTILVLYLTSILNYSDDDSTIIYHGFIFLSYFMPIFGAILADSYWGKFKTIICLSIVYAAGNIILTGASMANNFTLDTQRSIAITGLILISLGTGGIKPCVYTFGGDQFQLPEQQDQLASFFNRFITAIYIGSLISTFLTPELRRSTECFGRDTCYPLAFGVLSLLMISAIVIFILGRKMYVKKKPENHVIFKTFGCIFYALRKKLTMSTSDTAHWIDNASGQYSKIEVSSTKAALDVLYIFIAYPVFWALYEQQGSRWTLQATLMNGKIEGIEWEIKPDQIQTIHPIFALLSIFSFKSFLFPFLAKFGIKRPLQKLIFSNAMAVLAFMLTAFLQYKIFGESTVIPSNEGQFTIYNGFDCNIYINSSFTSNSAIGPLDSAIFKYTPDSDEDIVNVTLQMDNSCSPYTNNNKLISSVTVAKGEVRYWTYYLLSSTKMTQCIQATSYFLTTSVNSNVSLRRINHYDDFKKPKNGHPNVRIIISDDIKKDEYFTLVKTEKHSSVSYDITLFANENFKEVLPGKYNLTHNEKVISSQINLLPATIYTLAIRNDSNNMESNLYATDKGNYLHILWQTPQYAFMILADVIFVATTIEFSFTEAPPRIKSFISACYALTQSFGNLIVVFISAVSFHKQVHEYLFFSGLMLVNTILLVYLSYNYKYKSFVQRSNDDDDSVSEDVIENQNEVQLNTK